MCIIITTFRALDLLIVSIHVCEAWARLESHGHGPLKTGWQGRPDMKGATGGNEPSIVERKKGGSCHLTPHINTEEKHRPP